MLSALSDAQNRFATHWLSRSLIASVIDDTAAIKPGNLRFRRDLVPDRRCCLRGFPEAQSLDHGRAVI
jgi:hypothetical protein